MFDDLWAKLRQRVVVAPFPIPESWRIDRSLDWGSSKPCSVGFWAESDGTDYVDAQGKRRSTVRGDLFRIGELYTWNGKPNEGSRMLATELSRRIIEYEIKRGWTDAEGTIVRRGPADSSIFDEENGNCIERDLRAAVRIAGVEYNGPRFAPADKRAGSRKQGWQQIRKMFSAVEPVDGAPVRERPGMFVFDTCTHWLRTVPSLPRDDEDQDDVNTEAEDHAGDETRYRARFVKRESSSGRSIGDH
jgi:hypothetical protein